MERMDNPVEETRDVCLTAILGGALSLTSPLAKSFMYKGFKSSERMILGTAPDRQWYSFYSYVGGGSMGGSTKAKSFDEYRRGCDSFRSAVEENVSKTGSVLIPGA